MPNADSTLNKRMGIVALTWPIFIEVLLRTTLNTSDVFMLSGYSDKAVSAVGVISQISFFLIIVSTMVSSGTGILIAQYNGASRTQDSAHVGVASIILAIITGVLLSMIAVLGAEYFIPLYQLEAQVEQYAQEYLFISGALTFNVTIGVVRNKGIDLPMKQFKSVPKAIYQKIMKIGSMNAGEVLSYNMAQISITFFVVQMGTSSLAAFTYAQNIARLSFAFALAIGQGSQIQTGYYIGKGWIDEIANRVQRYFVVGFIASITITCVVYIFRFEILDLFTQDPEIIALTAALIAGSILLEAGRVFNLIFISCLKAAGDIKFPIKMGILSMWGIGVAMSYLLGVHWGYGVFGAWMAIAMDEWFRGLIMVRRWRAKKWTRFSL